MKMLLSHKVIISIFALLTFAISANALLYGVHYIHEINHSMALAPAVPVTSFTASISVTADHHDSEDGDPCRNSESNYENHSHASIADVPFSITPTSLIPAPFFLESFKTPPEVYLDKFVPPQNLT